MFIAAQDALVSTPGVEHDPDEIAQYRREILEAALAFAAAGVYVFPCHPADKTPNYSLVPRERGQQRGSWIKNSGGHLKATTDPAQITEWWTLCPDGMIGAYCLKSGIFVIDPDAPKQLCPGKLGEMTPDGRTAWAALKAEHGGHDPTFEVQTPGGGIHIYFRADPARPVTNSEGGLGGLGINVRSNGYVILPPSRRKDGKPYVASRPFTREAIATAPDWLYAALGTRRRAKPKPQPSAAPNGGEPPPPPGGSTIATISPVFPLTRENIELLHSALVMIPSDDYQVWFNVLAALRSIDPEWKDASRKIAVWWSKRSPKYDDAGFEKTWESIVPDKEGGIGIGTLFFEARNRGWNSGAKSRGAYDAAQGCGAEGVSIEDFRAYMPMHSYIFTPCREMWPATSVNARVPPVPLVNKSGTPALDDNGKQRRQPASSWLDQNRAVECMTWAPGEPILVQDRLISNGGWIERKGVSTFNLYRPPQCRLGDPAQANPWINHAHQIFGDHADHIIYWLAHRVQRPGEKINHALLLGGVQGVGKDTLLEPALRAIGPWNFHEVSPIQALGRFNGFLKSVILRISEARDLGDVDRFKFYDHMKTYLAAPPDVLRVDEKHLREHCVLNCCGVIITSNHKTDGLYLPADDRRHFVAWSDRTKDDFNPAYWNTLWSWYESGGFEHVAAYLMELDLSGFDSKAPPKKTPEFWDIVDASQAPEDAELADILDRLKNPDATTLIRIINEATGSEIEEWLRDRKNRRAIPYRLERCGYVPFRNDCAKDGLWKLNGTRQAVYVRSELSIRDRLRAAQRLVGQSSQ